MRVTYEERYSDMGGSGFNEKLIADKYDQYASTLFRVCAVQLGSSSDAEDVVQDVFLKYMSVMPIFNDAEHEKAWFLRVAINRCHDKRRSKFYRDTVSLDSIVQFAKTEGQGYVLEELTKLPEKFRVPLVLHYVEGYSVKEVAEILELTESAVKVRLHRAREKLKIEIEEAYAYV